MTFSDSSIRQAFVEACGRFGVDVTALSIEVRSGSLSINGLVPSDEQRHSLWSLLETVDARVTDIVCRVAVLPVGPSIGSSAAATVAGQTGTISDLTRLTGHGDDRVEHLSG